jgi:hypothetical protein
MKFDSVNFTFWLIMSPIVIVEKSLSDLLPGARFERVEPKKQTNNERERER